MPIKILAMLIVVFLAFPALAGVREVFQTMLMRLALCGLAASLLLLALRSRLARDTFARLMSIWRSLTAAGWSFSSDVPTSGTVRVTCLSGSEKVVAPGLIGEWAVYDDFSVSATVEGIGTSAAVGDVVYRMEFWGGSTTNTVEKALTVSRMNERNAKNE